MHCLVFFFFLTKPLRIPVPCVMLPTMTMALIKGEFWLLWKGRPEEEIDAPADMELHELDSIGVHG